MRLMHYLILLGFGIVFVLQIRAAAELGQLNEQVADLSGRISSLEKLQAETSSREALGVRNDSNNNAIVEAESSANGEPSYKGDSSEASSSGEASQPPGLTASETQALEARIQEQLALYGFSAYESARVSEIELAGLAEYHKLSQENHASVQQQLSQLMRSTMRLVRSEVGDFAYEAYLQSKDMPTSVEIKSIAKGSQARRLGLQVGDRIERYKGKRVYDVFELNQLVYADPTAAAGNFELVYKRGGEQRTHFVEAGAIGIHALPPTYQDFFNRYR